MRDNRGVTLVELLVVVAVIGILASIALPNYFEYVKRSNRAAAKTVLLQDAQYMERKFTETSDYSSVSTATLPYKQAPLEGASIYTLQVVATMSTYTLTASPVVGGSMDGDECGDFSINELGEKKVSAGDAMIAQCWGK